MPYLLSKILLNSPHKQSHFDSSPAWLLKKCLSILVPTTNIVNLSLSSGQFHLILKESTISPLIKKYTLDKDQLSNCRAVSKSNLSLISKIIERVVKSRLAKHLSSNNILNPTGMRNVNITPLKLLFSIIDYHLCLSYLLPWCFPRFCSWSSFFVLYTTPRSTLISSFSKPSPLD